VTLSASLSALDDAVDAAAVLGLDTSRARRVLADARQRLGFEGSAYVLALVGGTGVGKSSLLNALAGGVVSPAGARRPTTGMPVAWVAESARDETAPLLKWLDVREIRDHAEVIFADVAILDLPDVDSTLPEHRARVDALLPRVDAVVWVADPEKYRDAVLHDAYLRRWGPRLARQLVVLNKADRVGAEAERLRNWIGERFSVTLGRWHDVKVGPHDQAMYQVAFAKEIFPELVPWLMLNHGKLSVLVHPNTTNPRRDHLADPIWIGPALAVHADKLPEHAEMEEAPAPNTNPVLRP